MTRIDVFTDATEREREQLRKWHYEVTLDQRAHSEAGLYYTRRHRLLGGSAIALSAIVGTSVFASLSEIQLPGSLELWISLLVGLLSVTAGALAALQTFLGYSDLAAKHRQANADYGCVRRNIEELRARDRHVSLALELGHVRQAIDKVAKSSPEPPDRAWKKAHDEIDRREAA